MTTPDNLEGVLRRIQKLLAIAEDHRANPNEAAAAARQAEIVMRKYQIDNAALIAAELKGKKGASVVRHSAFANMKRDDPKRPPLVKNPPWASWLAVPLARLHDCEVRYGYAQSPRGVMEASIDFFGHEGDVQVAAWTYDYLVGALIAAMKEFQRVPRAKVESESYRRGFVIALASKLKAMRAEKEAELAQHSDSRALVVVKRDAIVEAFGAFRYGKAKSVNVRNSDAFSRGHAAGSKVDIRRAVGTNSASTTRRLA